MPFTSPATRIYKDPITVVMMNTFKQNDDYLYTGVAKAWLTFDPSAASLSAQSSQNIASIAGGTSSTYRISLTTGFANTGYAVFGIAVATGNGINKTVCIDDSGIVSTAAITIAVRDSGGGAANTSRVSVSFFGLSN